MVTSTQHTQVGKYRPDWCSCRPGGPAGRNIDEFLDSDHINRVFELPPSMTREKWNFSDAALYYGQGQQVELQKYFTTSGILYQHFNPAGKKTAALVKEGSSGICFWFCSGVGGLERLEHPYLPVDEKDTLTVHCVVYGMNRKYFQRHLFTANTLMVPCSAVQCSLLKSTWL